ncbi:MAG: ATP/GTP-binding protein [Candidatus Hodarchaeota archaeon]
MDALELMRERQIKIFVVGPFQAGKTTLIHSLDPYACSMEREGYNEEWGEYSTTVGFDLGKLVWLHGKKDRLYDVRSFKSRNLNPDIYGYEAWNVFLFGSPGQMWFKDVRSAISKGSDGVLFVVDSTRPGQVGYTLALLEEVNIALGRRVPTVIVANKQDVPQALRAEQIRRILRINEVEIHEISAINREGVERALIELLRIVRRKKMFNRSLGELWNA